MRIDQNQDKNYGKKYKNEKFGTATPAIVNEARFRINFGKVAYCSECRSMDRSKSSS